MQQSTLKSLLAFGAVLALILGYVKFFPTVSEPTSIVAPVPQNVQNQPDASGRQVAPSKPNEAREPAGEEAEEAEEAEGKGAAPVAPAKKGLTYGAPVDETKALAMTDLAAAMGKSDSVRVALVGEATSVCQVKGCWMTLPTADGKQMRVRFKDYGFFVPANLRGHRVAVQGTAHRETVPVASLQHYAKDAGKSAQEIAAITKDEQQLTFMADGVKVLN